MIDVQISHNLSVCPYKEESALPIPVSEWTHLKLKVTRICPQRQTYQNLASLCCGIFASAIFALITYYADPASTKTWILPTYLAVMISSGVLAFALYLIDGQQKVVIRQSTQSLTEDMEVLEHRYKIDQ